MNYPLFLFGLVVLPGNLWTTLLFFQEPATELHAVGAVLDFENELIGAFSKTDFDATMIREGATVSPFIMDEFTVEPDLGRIVVTDAE